MFTSSKKLLKLTILFLALDLLLEKVVAFHFVNWLHEQLSLNQLQSNFIFKLIELLIVLGLNVLITKQRFYLRQSFSWWGSLYWIFILLILLPFLVSSNIGEAIATGMMGGFSEEFLARGVFRIFLTYFLQSNYSESKLMKAVLYSNLIFALMHFTNLTHELFSYVLLQSVLAFFSGLALSAIYIQTGSMWPAIALHFTSDFILTANGTGKFILWEQAGFSYFQILFVVITFFYWRKHEPLLSRLIRKNVLKTDYQE